MTHEVEKRGAIEDIIAEHEDDGFGLHSSRELGGTEADGDDMRMLGRTQQLNVRISRCRPYLDLKCLLTNIALAELSFCLNPGVRMHTDEYLGDCTDV